MRCRGVGVLLALVLSGVVACGDGKSNQAVPSTGPSAPSTTSTMPACSPAVTDSGFYNRQNGYIFYGLIVNNPCDQAAVNNKIRAVAVDATGRELSADTADSGAILPVILPRQRLGVTAVILLAHDLDKVTGVKAQVTSHGLLPASTFVAWPKSITARNITYGAADAAGSATMTFMVVTDPAGATACDPVAHIIVRDRSGKIVYGVAVRVAGSAVELHVVLPPGADTSKTEVYFVQGKSGIGPNWKAQMSCAINGN